MTVSYPRMTSPEGPAAPAPRNLRNIPTISPPPIPHKLPLLPSAPRDPFFTSTHSLTTHLVPAAYPRYPSYTAVEEFGTVPNKPTPEEALTKTGRTAWAARTHDLLHSKRDVVFECDSKNETPTAPGPLLWNAVNRIAYTAPTYNRKDVGLTIVVTHANGFHKEIWEPTLRHIIALSQRPRSGIRIDEIWVMDAVNHGDSALINAGNLSDIIEWADLARDVINFAQNHIPEGEYDLSATTSPLPVHLPRVSSEISRKRLQSGCRGIRHLVGMGHSAGGNSMAWTACTYPALFESLLLVDPVIVPRYVFRGPRHDGLVTGALLRRESWPSKKDALESLSKSPFFAAWDPEVLKLYVEYGLYTEADGSARLKMPGFQEASTFSEMRAPLEVYDLLPSMDESVRLKWVMSGKGAVATGGENATNDTVWRRLINSSNIRVASAGHLIAHEAPFELAKEAIFYWRVHLAEQHDPMWARL